MFSCEYSKSFWNNFFHRTNTVAAFDLCFSFRKNFKKKKVSGEIAFDLISLFHVQMPTRSSTTTTAFAFPAKFYYHKIFEIRSRWWPKCLCSWMQPLCPLYNWRYKDLSKSRDLKVMTLLPPTEKSPIVFYHGGAFTA